MHDLSSWVPRHAKVIFPFLAGKCDAPVAASFDAATIHPPKHDPSKLLHTKCVALQCALVERTRHSGRMHNKHVDTRSRKR